MVRVAIPGKESGSVMPKRLLEGHTREERAAQRKKLGPLKSLTVQPVTRKRYDKAMHDFYQFLRESNLFLPTSALGMDTLLSDYLEHLWASGFGRAEASNVLAALQDVQPHLKGKLAQSWRLLKAWSTHEVPNRAPPLPLDMLEAMVGYCLFKNQVHMGLSLLVAYHGLLRTGEVLSLTAGAISVQRAKGPAVLSLGWTKSGKRQGASESVTLYGEDVCRRLHQWIHSCGPKAPLCPPAHVWRRQFADILTALSFDKWDFRPYSLRRGGATHQFRAHGSFDRLMQHGRWQSLKTARVYINDGMAVLAQLSIPWTPFSTNLRSQYLSSLTTRLPPLEPAQRKRVSQSGGSRKKKSKRTGKKEKTRVGVCYRVGSLSVLGLAG